MEDRGKIKFDEALVNSLKKMGFTIYTENIEMKKKGTYGSQPDFVAIKDKLALIIETKSKDEGEENSWLAPESGSPNHPEFETFKNFREFCANFPNKDTAAWIVPINLQALYYPMVYKKPHGWEMRKKEDSENFEGCTQIPTLAFPESFKKQVQDAVRLMGIEINENQFMELGSGQLLLKFDIGQRMVEPPTS